MGKEYYRRKDERRDSPYEDRRGRGSGGGWQSDAVYAEQGNGYGQSQGWQDWQAGATRPYPPPTFAPQPPFFPNQAAPPFGQFDWGPYGQPYAPQPGPSNWQAWGPPVPPFQPPFPTPNLPFNDAPFVPAPAQPFFHPTAPTQAPFSPSAPFENGWHSTNPVRSGTRPPRSPARGRRDDNRRAEQDRPDHRVPLPYAYAGDGTYVPPTRRERMHRREGPAYPPTQTYLDAANGESETFETEEQVGTKEPVVLVLDLNNTLLVRGERNAAGSKTPVVRPYLATFLEYICTTTEPDLVSGKPRFQPIIYSSARSYNVLSMLAAINLIPPSRVPPPFDSRAPFPAAPIAEKYRSPSPSRSPTPPPRHGDYVYVQAPYKPEPSEGDVLKLVFTREMMGLSPMDYHGDVETVKDLAKVWERLGWAEESGSEGGRRATVTSRNGVEEALSPEEVARRDEMGAQRTLLLDDEAGKAAQQPYSHLPIRPYLIHQGHMPRFPYIPRNSRSSRSPSPISSIDPEIPSYLRALEVRDDHPPAWDDALLRSVWELENLRRESNVAAAVKSGFLQWLRDDAREAVQKAKEGKKVTEEMVDAELAKRGRMVCERLGIEVRRKWDPRWRQRVLQRREDMLAKAERAAGKAAE
ncbi:Salivary gland secretion 1 [Rhodotorula toruloides ATCC 204091]|nr:Salivary gland secretion 1 [Rhodotorula toruloides ATCC 204091]